MIGRGINIREQNVWAKPVEEEEETESTRKPGLTGYYLHHD
jgi:hypothetical protein